MRRQIATCILACLVAVGAAAEVTAQVQVPSPTPASARLMWDHDGVNTDRYLLIVDGGAPTDLGKPTPTAGTYAVPFPALTPGNHSLVLCAENIAGRGCTAPLTVALVVVPTMPTQFKVVISIGDE